MLEIFANIWPLSVSLAKIGRKYRNQRVYCMYISNIYKRFSNNIKPDSSS